jgi:uncharacterized membrane protein
MPTNPGDFGSFGPTTNVWDITELQDVDVKSPAFKELLVRLYQNINLMALVLQVADKGIYDTQEFVNGQLWFPNPNNNSSTLTSPQYRQVFRTVVNFGALPAVAGIAKQVRHNIVCTPTTTFTRIYGSASDTTALTYIPITYAGVNSTNIEIYIDDTYVNIVSGEDRSMYNACYVILEYLYQ